MTTDKTPATLATVKHGGCVQLGDALADEIDLIRAVLDGYPDSIARTDALRAVRVIAAALTAQPSPGGQVDGLVESLVQVMNAQYDGLGYLPADVLGVLNMAVEALAARQPVGEPVAYMVRWKTAGGFGLVRLQDMKYYHDLHDEHEIVPLYRELPPAQAVDLGAAIKAAFPLLTDYGLHHSHCCEYKLIDERHRLHNLIDSHAAGGQS